MSAFSCYYCFHPKNPQKWPGKKSYAFVSHADMFKLDFYPSLIIPQSANTGLSRTFFLQADKVGHFSFFVSDFVWFSLKLKMEQTLEYCSSLTWAQNPKPSSMAFPNYLRYLLVKFHWILWHWLYYQKWGHPAILYPSAFVYYHTQKMSYIIA